MVKPCAIRISPTCNFYSASLFYLVFIIIILNFRRRLVRLLLLCEDSTWPHNYVQVYFIRFFFFFISIRLE